MKKYIVMVEKGAFTVFTIPADMYIVKKNLYTDLLCTVYIYTNYSFMHAPWKIIIVIYVIRSTTRAKVCDIINAYQ